MAFDMAQIRQASPTSLADRLGAPAESYKLGETIPGWVAEHAAHARNRILWCSFALASSTSSTHVRKKTLGQLFGIVLEAV